jgi:hypothetical protein
MLKEALQHKKKHKKKGKALDLQQRQEYHGSAVHWSPRKLRKQTCQQTSCFQALDLILDSKPNQAVIEGLLDRLNRLDSSEYISCLWGWLLVHLHDALSVAVEVI